MKRAFIIIGVSFASLAVIGGTIYAAAQVFETTKTDRKTVSRSVDHIVIKAEAGDIDVAPGGGSVEIEQTNSYVFDDPEISETVEDGVLTIESDCDGVTSLFCETDFRIEVPEGVTVDARSYFGDIEVDGIAARRIEARAYVGDVEIDARRKGDVTARTNVGDVDVEMPRGTYDIDADAAAGDADVDGLITSDRADHTVDAQSDVGAVDVTAHKP